MSELWKRVDSCRAKKGISLKQLGEICGISPQGVQKWKHTGRIPVEHLTTLSAYFSITIDALIGVNPDDQIHPGQAAPAPPPATLAVAPPATAPPCRYPADCDLDKRLSAMETDLATMRIQNDTLIRLLGGTLAAKYVAGGEKKKAG
ncbi:MAG: helix-turn-helix domain-containing protein [Kiritimatiellia bacterium]